MLHARKHRKVSMAKAPEAEFCQHPSASRVAGQVPCKPKSPLSKQMWRPKQKALGKASGVAAPEVRLSREEKGKMPACSNNAASREVIMATVPSPIQEQQLTPASFSRAKLLYHSVRAMFIAAKLEPKHHSVLRSPVLRVLNSLFAAEQGIVPKC